MKWCNALFKLLNCTKSLFPLQNVIWPSSYDSLVTKTVHWAGRHRGWPKVLVYLTISTICACCLSHSKFTPPLQCWNDCSGKALHYIVLIHPQEYSWGQGIVQVQWGVKSSWSSLTGHRHAGEGLDSLVPVMEKSIVCFQLHGNILEKKHYVCGSQVSTYLWSYNAVKRYATLSQPLLKYSELPINYELYTSSAIHTGFEPPFNYEDIWKDFQIFYFL